MTLFFPTRKAAIAWCVAYYQHDAEIWPHRSGGVYVITKLSA